MLSIGKLLFSFLLVFEIGHGALLGIDYGHQLLKAMVISPQAPLEIVLTPESKRKDTSGLAIMEFNGEIERIYGSAVGSLVTRQPQNSFLHIKPLIGKSIDDVSVVSNYLKHHPGINITSSPWNSLSFVVDGNEFPIEQLLAMNIQEIVNRANKLLQDNSISDNSDTVRELAISIPNYYDQYQREAILNAVSMAVDDLDAVIIPDGLSVAISFVLKEKEFTPDEPQYYAIYDMGGSSTQASLFSVLKSSNSSEPIQIEMGSYKFNDNLGGSTFTLAIANIIENKFLEKNKDIRSQKLHADPRAMAKINQAAEKAKLVLSANSVVTVSIESLINDIDFKVIVTRSEFEDFIQNEISDAVIPLEELFGEQLWQPRISVKQLKGVLLFGGGNRIPSIQERVSEFIGKDKILRTVNTDEAAVNGVSIKGVKTFNSFKLKPLDTVDHSPSQYSIGLSSSNKLHTVFAKGTDYPRTSSHILFVDDYVQSNFTFDLYEDKKLFNTVTIDLESSRSKLSKKECPGGVAINATFILNRNRQFFLEKSEAICMKNSLTLKSTGKDVEKTEILEANDINFGGKNGSPFNMKFSNNYRKIEKVSVKDIESYKSYNANLEEADKNRYELNEAKNILEGLLYSGRELLDNEEIRDGPAADIEELSNIIPEYLEWLEQTSKKMTKGQINRRIGRVNNLMNKIDFFLRTVNEVLDVKEFARLLQLAEKLSSDVAAEEQGIQKDLIDSKDSFTNYNLDITQEFSNVKVPQSISNNLRNWHEKLSDLKDNIYMVKYLKNTDMLKRLSRERLFSIKQSIKNAISGIEESISFYFKELDYRIRSVQSTYERKVRSAERKLKRAEEKKALKDAKSDTNTVSKVKTSRRNASENEVKEATSTGSGTSHNSEKSQVTSL
ncbi:hypothetical protein Kpol_1019p2 [Vanderwaltozyma polyspora DSM 70294]|uniref:Lumenal Hsp70 protein n=1 Tax=Vanderwaltozyma polyspora (strain ATCC 22028 / DSM 70294 / BCRC 21397 / CBS 2163 / NBRC 10782 / NRRL Y-8283 / UCD 57-17) TaxID=436907 RepID=A7TP95_VANPO|nr:uncharacterized protein Kpol_1019p2 [Vanderwaltozyma polyspora DSM 70294]EDO15882.1 hypothetical protein Kpol_1019p2 [Vanderwaltozyma polyspora DSM 70294]